MNVEVKIEGNVATSNFHINVFKEHEGFKKRKEKHLKETLWYAYSCKCLKNPLCKYNNLWK